MSFLAIILAENKSIIILDIGVFPLDLLWDTARFE